MAQIAARLPRVLPKTLRLRLKFKRSRGRAGCALRPDAGVAFSVRVSVAGRDHEGGEPSGLTRICRRRCQPTGSTSEAGLARLPAGSGQLWYLAFRAAWSVKSRLSTAGISESLDRQVRGGSVFFNPYVARSGSVIL